METRSRMSRSLHTNRDFEKLEPYEGKPSRTVLRGEEGSNALDLPDRPSDAHPLRRGGPRRNVGRGGRPRGEPPLERAAALRRREHGVYPDNTRSAHAEYRKQRRSQRNAEATHVAGHAVVDR